MNGQRDRQTHRGTGRVVLIQSQSEFLPPSARMDSDSNLLNPIEGRELRNFQKGATISCPAWRSRLCSVEKAEFLV